MLVSNFEEIFQFEKFPVEYICYQQFLSDCPKDFTYWAIPWTQILNSGWLDFPFKKSMQFYIDELLKMQRIDGETVTVCQHDDYMQLIPIFRRLGIDTVFSPLHDINNTDTQGIKIIPIPFNCNFDFKIPEKKDIMVSFIGTPTSHPIRARMQNRIHGEGIIFRSSYHVDSNFFYIENYKHKEEEQYKDIMERSQFSLCPRGSSPSSVRFWESLAAASIPILISDNWVLPEWDWDNTILRISEHEFEYMNYNDIIDKIASISKDQKDVMYKNCLKAYEHFKHDNFKKYIIENK